MNYFGIIAKGEHRVINEFQNGNIYMIEKNEPVDFVGEVTILAGMEKNISDNRNTDRNDCHLFFPEWILNNGLKKIFIFCASSHKKSLLKLYRSSY